MQTASGLQKAGVTQPPFALNPSLDLAVLAEGYQRRRKYQVKDFFEEAAARNIQQILHDLPWGMVFNQGERVATLRDTDLKGLTAGQWQEIRDMVAAGAFRGYQYIYDVVTLVADYFDPQRPWSPIFPLFEYLNSKPFLDFARELTGDAAIVWADANPSRFRPGHFLMRHTDEVADKDRRIAFVMNFTTDWGGDWGGYLQFYDSDSNIELAYKPAFNVLNLFAIPQDHSVGLIAPFARQPRLSVAGWFRGDQPKRPIGDRSVFGGATA